MRQAANTIDNKAITIRGVVVPEQWDDQFKVTRVHIACKGEREVRVANLESFPALLSFSQTEVLVSGFLAQSDDEECIVVESFRPLGEE